MKLIRPAGHQISRAANNVNPLHHIREFGIKSSKGGLRIACSFKKQTIQPGLASIYPLESLKLDVETVASKQWSGAGKSF